MLYQRIKKIIESGSYNKETLLNQLDVFLLSQRITNEQYAELVGMINK
jgi:hypothetical protein